MADDPTLKLLDRLEDESQWKVLRSVPIFRAHQRKLDGGKLLKVTDRDLEDIAKVVARRMKTTGEVPVVTIGHRRQKPDEPETNQPDIVGYAQNLRVGTFGPGRVTGLLADLYFHPEDYSRAMKYPFRSLEYYPNTDESTGVAMLKRDPMLDLGMLVEYGGRGSCLLYAMDGEGKEDMDDKDDDQDDANPAKTLPDQADGDGMGDMSDDEKKRAEMYMCKQYAGLREWLDEQRKQPGAAPLPGPDRDAMTPSQRSDLAAQYQRLQRENTQIKVRSDKLEGEQKALREQIKQLQFQRDVADMRAHEVQILLDEGVMIPDPEREAKKLARMRPDEREERVAELRTYYQRDPTRGPMVPLAIGTNSDPDVITERHQNQALAYQRQNPDCSWDEAVEKTRGK